MLFAQSEKQNRCQRQTIANPAEMAETFACAADAAWQFASGRPPPALPLAQIRRRF
jgi:hypothetical protein